MILMAVSALLGALSFAILFQAPRRYYLPCSIVGGVVWGVSQLLTLLGVQPPAACAAATLLLAALARLLAVVWRVPVSIFLIPGIIPLVPGAGVFYIGYYLISAQSLELAQTSSQVLLTAGAIALGITFGSALPTSWFQWAAARLAKWRR